MTLREDFRVSALMPIIVIYRRAEDIIIRWLRNHREKSLQRQAFLSRRNAHDFYH